MPAPTLTSITPSVGGTIGGAAVTLVGTNFTGATGVTIGGGACTSVVVVNATTITCQTPAGTRGAASVVVTNSSGSNGANTLYVYLSTVPTDTYIYLKGGRGDGFVPGWTGESRDAVVPVMSEPYRNTFHANSRVRSSPGSMVVTPPGQGGTITSFVTVVGEQVDVAAAIVPSEEAAVETVQGTYASTADSVSNGTIKGVVPSSFKFTTSDEVKGTPPRQYSRLVTFRYYMSSSGKEYHYELPLISGVGDKPRY